VLGVGSAGPMTRGGEDWSRRSTSSRGAISRCGHIFVSGSNIDVYIDGDARALALAEGTYGAARDDDSYLSMVVSTGIGGGLVMDGRLVDGATGNSGHVGHTNVVPNGRRCAAAAVTAAWKPKRPAAPSKRSRADLLSEADERHARA
jgi:glucokinase